MSHYWSGVFSKAFWDCLAFFGQNPSLLLVGLIGAVVTAILVLVFRGKEAFMEHLKANVIIAFGGGIVTWLLFFPYFLFRAPAILFSESQAQLERSLERERAAWIGRHAAELELQSERSGASAAIARLQASSLKTGGAVRPSTQQPQTTTEQPRPAGLSYTEELIPSTRNDADYAIRVVIQTKVSISPVRIAVICSAPLVAGIHNNGGAFQMYSVGVIGNLKNAFMIQYESPALTPQQPIVVELFAKTAVHVLRLQTF